jgi:hypothetical protein
MVDVPARSDRQYSQPCFALGSLVTSVFQTWAAYKALPWLHETSGLFRADLTFAFDNVCLMILNCL